MLGCVTGHDGSPVAEIAGGRIWAVEHLNQDRESALAALSNLCMYEPSHEDP